MNHMSFDDMVADMARQIIAQAELAAASAAPGAALTRFLSSQYIAFPEVCGPAETKALEIIPEGPLRLLLSRSIIAAGVAHARGDDASETAQ